jgi:hypothetical protein
MGCLGRLLALALGLVFALVLIELAGRFLLGFDPLPGWAQDFNNRAGYELRPHETYIYASKNGEFENRVQANSRGLHDVEHTLDKPDGVFRILILSDSYGQAREVPIAMNFARQLETLLNQAAPDDTTFEVINAGYFGLGTTQEYLYYTVEGKRYDPNLVLLGFYVGNDVVDNHAPLVRAWNQMDTVGFPYFTTHGTLHQPGMAVERRALSWFRQNSYLAHTINDVLAGTNRSDRVEVGDPNKTTEQALRVPMGIYLPPDDTWKDAWSVTEHALVKLQTAVEQNGARLGVFIIPDRRQVYDDDWTATLARLPDLPVSGLDRERPTKTIESLLQAHNISELNLLEPFRAAEDRLYFMIDGHFNPAGHTLTAQLLASWLHENGLIPGSSGE